MYRTVFYLKQAHTTSIASNIKVDIDIFPRKTWWGSRHQNCLLIIHIVSTTMLCINFFHWLLRFCFRKTWDTGLLCVTSASVLEHSQKARHSVSIYRALGTHLWYSALSLYVQSLQNFGQHCTRRCLATEWHKIISRHNANYDIERSIILNTFTVVEQQD